MKGSLGKDLFAIKCVAKRTSKAASDNLIREISILKNIKSDYIVQLHDFQWDGFYIYLIFEYCDAGDLRKYLDEIKRPLPMNLVRHFLQQLAAALQVIREKSISHFDLKPQNILLTHRPDRQLGLKLADFGFAIHLEAEEELTSIRGSPLYLAPEILRHRKYDARADLWSVGVILFESVYGVPPFRAENFVALAELIRGDSVIKAPANVNRVSASCRDLLHRLLQRDPDKRISFEKFFDHPFLDLQHMPTKDSYTKGVSLVTEAVRLDGCGSKTEAYEKYLAGLQFLVPVLSYGTGEPDFIKQRDSLRTKINSYVRRAEELKGQCNGNRSNLSSKEETALLKAYDQAYDADELAESGYAQEALAKYRQALEVLVPLMAKFQGAEKDSLYKQLSDWIEKAEKIKITCDAEREKLSDASHKSREPSLSDPVAGDEAKANMQPGGEATSTTGKKPGPWITLKKRSKKGPSLAPVSPMTPDETFLPTNTCRVQ